MWNKIRSCILNFDSDLPKCILFPSSLIIVFMYLCCQEVLCVLDRIKINILGVVFANEWCVCVRINGLNKRR